MQMYMQAICGCHRTIVLGFLTLVLELLTFYIELICGLVGFDPFAVSIKFMFYLNEFISYETLCNSNDMTSDCDICFHISYLKKVFL